MRAPLFLMVSCGALLIVLSGDVVIEEAMPVETKTASQPF